jgi:hypothetical protein
LAITFPSDYKFLDKLIINYKSMIGPKRMEFV